MSWAECSTEPQGSEGQWRQLPENDRQGSVGITSQKFLGNGPAESFARKKWGYRQSSESSTSSPTTSIFDLSGHDKKQILGTNISSSDSLPPSLSASASDVTSNTGPTELSQSLATRFANVVPLPRCSSDRDIDDGEIGDVDSTLGSWQRHSPNLDSYRAAGKVPSDVPEEDEDDDDDSSLSVSGDATPFANTSIEGGMGEQILAARKIWIVAAYMEEFYTLFGYPSRSMGGSSENTPPSELSLSTSNASVQAAPGPESGVQTDVVAVSPQNQKGALRKGKKRARRTSDSENGDQEEDDTGKHGHESSSLSAAKARIRFACPYAKRFGRSTETPQACVHPGFDGIHRLKGKSGHLERDHVLAEIHCPDCFKEFKRPRDLIDHSRAHGPSSCPGFGSIPITKMDREKFNAIQAINGKPPQSMSQETQWKEVWCIIFFDDEEALANIPSPYIDAHAVCASSDDQINQFDRYMRAALPGLMQSRVEAMLDMEPAAVTLQKLVGGMSDMLDSCHQEISSNFRSERGMPVPDAFQHTATTEHDLPIATLIPPALEAEIRGRVAQERIRASQSQSAEQQHVVEERLILQGVPTQGITDSAYRSTAQTLAHQPSSSELDESRVEQTEEDSPMGYTVFSGVDSAYANESGTFDTGTNLDDLSNFIWDFSILPEESRKVSDSMEPSFLNSSGQDDSGFVECPQDADTENKL